MFPAGFFQVIEVSNTTHDLPKVQQSGRQCMFTKIEGNAHDQSNVAEQRL